MKINQTPKIAIFHDWFTTYAGSERVVEQLLSTFPEADVFALVDLLPENNRTFLNGRKVNTSKLQNYWITKKYFRPFVLLFPWIVEQFDFSSYDVVITSSHCVAKGAITGPDQLNICICYSPMRYIWDLQHQYLKESGLANGIRSFFVRWMLSNLRTWDARTAQSVDFFIAISHYIKRRIKKVYGRDSVVIYPPLDTKEIIYSETKKDVYITASRFVAYKKIDLIVDAFREMPEKRLIVIGDGPMFKKIQQNSPKNVSLMGWVTQEELNEKISEAKAFIFAAEEDFGLAPLEAQASGTPVIAFRKGGATETLVGIESDAPTAVYFENQDKDAICNAIDEFEKMTLKISPKACRDNASKFSVEQFRRSIENFVLTKWHERQL